MESCLLKLVLVSIIRHSHKNGSPDFLFSLRSVKCWKRSKGSGWWTNMLSWHVRLNKMSGCILLWTKLLASPSKSTTSHAVVHTEQTVLHCCSITCSSLLNFVQPVFCATWSNMDWAFMNLGLFKLLYHYDSCSVLCALCNNTAIVCEYPAH